MSTNRARTQNYTVVESLYLVDAVEESDCQLKGLLEDHAIELAEDSDLKRSSSSLRPTGWQEI
jgi:hypothetical protein